VNVTPGGASLLSLMASGQVSLNQSNYGQGGYTPSNGTFAPAQPASVAQPTGQASALTVASPPVYAGN
jgi:hypothetical protein